jgi:hypothetical protein
MARRSHRPRGRRSTRRWIYIIPVLLIIAVVIAFAYGPFGKNKSIDETADITPEANVPEMNETEPEIVKEPEPEPLREPPPEPVLEPNLPKIAPVQDVEPNPEAAALIAEATALLSEKPSRIIDAREKLNETLRIPMNIQQRTFVKDQMSELANKWLLSKTIFPDDELCGSYLVKSGDLLSTIGKRYKVPWEILKEINKISRPETLQLTAHSMQRYIVRLSRWICTFRMRHSFGAFVSVWARRRRRHPQDSGVSNPMES